MKSSSKRTSIAALLSIYLLGLAGVSARAQFIDTFSTNSSADYNVFATFVAAGGAAQTYAINASHQFQPNVTGQTTTYFIRNTGESLSDTIFKQSVSIELDHLGLNAAGGLGFSTTVNSAANAFEFGIITNAAGAGGKIDSFGLTGGPATTLTYNFSLGPIQETVTRTGNTTFSYAFSGAGLTSGPLSGTFTDTAVAGKDLFFGMENYTSLGTNVQIEDNLMYVPEPRAWAMILGGLALFSLMLRFRKSTS